MPRRFVLVVSSILLVYLAINYYIGWHLNLFLETLFAFSPGAWTFWVPFWIVGLAYLLARLLERFLPAPLILGFKLIGSYWFGILMYAVLLLPAADLIALLLRLFTEQVPASYIAAAGWIILVLMAIVLIIGSYNAWRPVVRRYALKVEKKAGRMETLRIAVASDLHLGSINRERHLKHFVQRMNALKPDLILLPGDILDDDIKPFIEQNMIRTLCQLQARLGVYAVLGNHEYIGGKPTEFAELLQKNGIEMLLDRSVKVADSFYVIGRKDRSAGSARFGSAGRRQLEEMINEVDASLPIIVLDHQPYGLQQAADAGADIMLSGHTHRGQLFPNHLITRRLFELDWGHKLFGRMHAVVSSGYGTWGPPLRLGSRSEILELTVNFNGNEN